MRQDREYNERDVTGKRGADGQPVKIKKPTPFKHDRTNEEDERPSFTSDPRPQVKSKRQRSRDAHKQFNRQGVVSRKNGNKLGLAKRRMNVRV